MDGWLKQSTSIEIKVGPFVSSTDGVTPQTSLTITSSEVLLSKNEGDWAAKNESTSLVHESNGFYRCLFNTTDTNTLALLRYQIAESGCLPVWGSFLVVPTNIYDSFFSTDLLQVDLTQWLGSTPSALASGRVDASAGAIGNAAITDAAVAVSGAAKIRSVVFGTADSGSTTTMVDSARTESATDYWKGCLILFGTGLNQCRLITGFNPSTDTITFAPPTTTAISTHDYEILPAARVDLHSWLGSVANSLISGRVDANAQAIADGAIAASTFTANAINDGVVSSDMDSYHARIWVIRNSTTADEYGVTFLKNGMPLESGVTSPLIDYVKRLSDASILINDASLTDQGDGDYYYSEGTNTLVAGRAYMIRITATIAGSSWTFKQQIGRDAT